MLVRLESAYGVAGIPRYVDTRHVCGLQPMNDAVPENTKVAMTGGHVYSVRGTVDEVARLLGYVGSVA